MFKKHSSVKWKILNEIKLNKQYFYECKCICGREKLIHKGNITSGKSTQCNRCGNKRHGDVYTRLYSIWRSMKGRCTNKKQKNYKGKGVFVCKDWQKYENFKKWALKNGYKENLTIDRINNNGNYESSNCRWATYAQQMRNTSRNVKINGIVAQDLANELGIKRTSIVKRIKEGWTEKAIRANPIELKIMNLPKYIMYRSDNNQYRVRYGSSGKINIGTFKTLKEAELALKEFKRVNNVP